MTQQEQIEDIIKFHLRVSRIPEKFAENWGKGGEKLLVLTREGDIILRKTSEMEQ